MAHATTGIPPALSRALRREIEELADKIARARRGEAAGVHRARVASRRLREALPLVATIVDLDHGHLEREVRRITRALGGVREMDVARDLLQKTAQAADWRPSLVELIDRDCARIRHRREKAMAARIEPRVVDDLLSRLEALLTANEGGKAAKAAAAVAAARVRRRAAALRAALAAAGTLYSAEPLHAVRIAAKKLRYALEVAHAVTRVGVAPEIRLIKNVQTQLGTIHDLQVLQGRVQAVGSSPRLDRATSRQFAGIDQDLERRCRELHGRFLKSAPRVRALTDAMARDAALLFVRDRAGRMARMLPTRSGGLPAAAGGHR